MKPRTEIEIVTAIAIAACANMARAQWSQPQYRGGTTCYNNANGSSAGSSYRSGNTTYYNNANGSSAGRSTTMGNTTYFYNANGSSAGTATKIGK